MRAHFYRALTDQEGNQIPEADIRVLVAGTTDPILETVYAEATGSLTRTNPWTTTNGEIDFYLDAPARVQIGVTVTGSPEEFWDNVDVLAVGTDSAHPGAGTSSTQVGLAATASGISSTSVGAQALATADETTAVGTQAAASATGGTAVGYLANASYIGALAAGRSALAEGDQATAVGDAAHAQARQSTALGAGATTSRPNQVVLGTAGDLVEVPGTAVLTSPNGTRYTLAVTDDGHLYAQQLAPYEPVPDDG